MLAQCSCMGACRIFLLESHYNGRCQGRFYIVAKPWNPWGSSDLQLRERWSSTKDPNFKAKFHKKEDDVYRDSISMLGH